MQSINNLLSDYMSVINCNNDPKYANKGSTKEEKIKYLINQITGEGNKKGGSDNTNKKIIGVKVIETTENNEGKFKDYLLNLKNNSNQSTNQIHQFFSSENSEF